MKPNYTMDGIPIELKFEISKFLKNKHETFTCYSLSSKYIDSPVPFRNLQLTYVCTSLKLLKWYAKKFRLVPYMFHCVSKNGALKNMKWLKKNGCQFDDYISGTAAASNIKIMKWLSKCNSLNVDGYLYNCAVRSGKMKNVKWIQKNKSISYNKNTFLHAAISGNLKLMKWLKKHGCILDHYTFSYAVGNGNLKNMKWLKKNNCPWVYTAFSMAASFGNLKNMKWLKKYNCPWVELTFTSASIRGNIKIMKWLKKNNCPWNERTITYSAFNKQAIKWVNENLK